LFADLIRLPHLMAAELETGSLVREATDKAANSLQNSRGFFFMGRGYSYPIALEGALKLKEIAYVHAEGYAAGELKHGPIAMIDSNMAVVVLAPRDHWRDKTVSNLEEVKARGAKILGIGSVDDMELKRLCDHWIPLTQNVHESLMPFFLTIAVQLLSYNIAVLKGTDVDKPRNLAKSVTVE
jgi:glucosamine--fructose-6-phosphate aminotransferase (isomerizing)